MSHFNPYTKLPLIQSPIAKRSSFAKNKTASICKNLIAVQSSYIIIQYNTYIQYKSTMAPIIDSQGRCPSHPFVQLQRLSPRTNEWKALLDSCPLCVMDNKSTTSSVCSSVCSALILNDDDEHDDEQQRGEGSYSTCCIVTWTTAFSPSFESSTSSSSHHHHTR